jgi:ATP-dependent DNA helicase RecG
MTLDTTVSELNRVGKIASKRLNHLGVQTVRDLLFYFPFRYEDFSKTLPIAQLKEGDQVTVQGKIELIANKRSHRKKVNITEAVVADESDQLRVVWFGQPFLTKTLKVGDTVYLSGKVTSDMFGPQMVSPTYEKNLKYPRAASLTSRFTSSEILNYKSTKHTARIVPIYPTTAGLTQKQIRFLVSQVIDLASQLEEWLPDEIRDRVDLMGLQEAIKTIHFPDGPDEVKHAERRLKFDELFILQLRAEMIRQSLKRSKANKISFKEDEIRGFVGSLPFTLTKDQKVSAWKILKDLDSTEPMNRMLEGDVGSGKTVVAAMALYSSVLNGCQSTMVAPTEILAKQHFQSLQKLLPDLKLALLTASEISVISYQLLAKSKKARREELLRALLVGEIDLIVGTHAVLQDDVKFKNLGLVVVDEQHRFGVDQRKKLRETSGDNNTTSHFLSMTATPIPRSFALTIYGDLDISMIKEKPAGRKEIQTRVVEPNNRSKAYEFIRQQIKAGRQAFVICPLIQTTDDGLQSTVTADEKKTVMSEYEKLSRNIFSDLRIGYLHGKLKSREKDETMKEFSEGNLDILVSTSVVEVGVDIPNASVMMIEGAESFGLAQLHQFRGRVGRSDHQSYCFLFSDSDSFKVRKRLEYFEKNTDGFKLAEYDLEVRGPGEVYGTAQSGMMNLKLASMRDKDLINLARETARGVDFQKFSTLKEKVKEWENSVHLE